MSIGEYVSIDSIAQPAFVYASTGLILYIFSQSVCFVLKLEIVLDSQPNSELRGEDL